MLNYLSQDRTVQLEVCRNVYAVSVFHPRCIDSAIGEGCTFFT